LKSRVLLLLLVVVVLRGFSGVFMIIPIFILFFLFFFFFRQGGQDLVDEPVSSLTLSFGMRFWGFATELMFGWDFIYFVCLLFVLNFFVYGMKDV
jgi:uncharacterized membrane protein (DUF106 family)